MKIAEILHAWSSILKGRPPSLSIEVTKECPLRCPGCYAYDQAHLGGEVTLRQLSDSKGSELVTGVLELCERLKPLHVSLVGGDPLVRYREMEQLVPQLIDRGMHVQLVTSAFREIPPSFKTLRNLNIVVSIDGLQPEHDERRKPATYDRILKSIAGQQVTVHCTVTSQMLRRPRYLQDFADFWAANQDVKRLWFSIFTPQIGADHEEILSPADRRAAVNEFFEIRRRHTKLDMPEGMIKEFLHPPQSPKDCIFALTTQTLSADFRTEITPCQFGGEPDCSQCGCIASMGLAAIGTHKLGGLISVGSIFKASHKIGTIAAKLPGNGVAAPVDRARANSLVMPQ